MLLDSAEPPNQSSRFPAALIDVFTWTSEQYSSVSGTSGCKCAAVWLAPCDSLFQIGWPKPHEEIMR
jgi:hypothetical protein